VGTGDGDGHGSACRTWRKRRVSEPTRLRINLDARQLCKLGPGFGHEARHSGEEESMDMIPRRAGGWSAGFYGKQFLNVNAELDTSLRGPEVGRLG